MHKETKFKLAVANEWALYAIYEGSSKWGSNKWTTHIRKPFIEIPLFKIDTIKKIPTAHHYEFSLHSCINEDGTMIGFYSIFNER